MATIDQIADGESGLSVRTKLNAVHDQIVEITAVYAQLQVDDVLIATAASSFDVNLLSVTAVPPLTPFKSLTVFNLAASAESVILVPFGAETIDGLASAVVAPGRVVTITPTATAWVTHNLGVVDSVEAGTSINITGTAKNPVVNVDTSITGQTINGVLLTDSGTAGTFLEADGTYSVAVTAVTGGSNITNNGTANVPVMDLDSMISGMTVNNVVLDATGDNFEYLAQDGQYTVPTGNIVETGTAYTQVVRDDVIIVDSVITFPVALIPLATAFKQIVFRNDGPASITIEPGSG